MDGAHQAWKEDIEKRWRSATSTRARHTILEPYLWTTLAFEDWHTITRPQSKPRGAVTWNARYYKAFRLNELCKEMDIKRCEVGQIPVALIDEAMRAWQENLKAHGCVGFKFDYDPFNKMKKEGAVADLLANGSNVLLIHPPKFCHHDMFDYGRCAPFSLEDGPFSFYDKNYIGHQVAANFPYLERDFKTPSFVTSAATKAILRPPMEAKLLKEFINFEIL